MKTLIAAPVERCFDLSRSIDLHVLSTSGTGERAIAGVTSGMIASGEVVTWKGRHFGVMLTHQSLISAYDRPHHFQDSMLRGAFRTFVHDHYFEPHAGGTLMTDIMEFSAPLGLLGRLAEILLLKRHMRAFLERRNACIKQTAESEKWKAYVSD